MYLNSCVKCGTQPDSPAELGSKIYEMMSMALGGRWGRAEEDGEEEKEEGEVKEHGEVVEEDAAAAESETQVIEPSEVRAESDPWND